MKFKCRDCTHAFILLFLQLLGNEQYQLVFFHAVASEYFSIDSSPFL